MHKLNNKRKICGCYRHNRIFSTCRHGARHAYATDKAHCKNQTKVLQKIYMEEQTKKSMIYRKWRRHYKGPYKQQSYSGSYIRYNNWMRLQTLWL